MIDVKIVYMCDDCGFEEVVKCRVNRTFIHAGDINENRKCSCGKPMRAYEVVENWFV